MCSLSPVIGESLPALPPEIEVLHLRACNFVGGPERQLLRYVGGAQPGGPRAAIATFLDRHEGEGRALLDACTAQGIAAVGLDAGGWRDGLAVAQLRRWLRHSRVRLLCCHAYRADLLGAVAAWRLPVPMAWFLRGWTGEDWKVRMFERWDRRWLGRAERVVCLSHLQAQRVQALGVEPGRIRVVPNSVESPSRDRAWARAQLQHRFQLPQDAVYVGTAGRLSPEKGSAVFCEAVSRLGEVAAGVCFLIFGEGPLRAQLEMQARALPAGRLRLLGFHQDFPDLVPGLDVLVNPSFREEMPNVVMEAMAAGVAVVATSVGGVAEIAGQPAAIELVPAGNGVALAGAMKAMLASPERRRQLALQGRERIAAAFSPQRQQQALQSLYAEFPGSQPVARR